MPAPDSENRVTKCGSPRLSLAALCFAPRLQIDGVHGDAKDIRGDEAELRGANADDNDNNAIDCGQGPTFPAAAADENG